MLIIMSETAEVLSLASVRNNNPPGLPWPIVECHGRHKLSFRGLASSHETSLACFQCTTVVKCISGQAAIDGRA